MPGVVAVPSGRETDYRCKGEARQQRRHNARLLRSRWPLGRPQGPPPTQHSCLLDTRVGGRWVEGDPTAQPAALGAEQTVRCCEAGRS